MLRRVSLSLLGGSALALAACATAPPPPPTNAPADITAVNALRDGFLAAFNGGDAEALRKLYTADAVTMGNHQPTVTGIDAIVSSQKEFFSQMSVKIELTPGETKTMGDTGFDRGHFKITLTPKAAGATPMTDEGRYVVLLQRTPDGWRVNRDIDNSSMPMPPPPAPAPAPGKKGK